MNEYKDINDLSAAVIKAATEVHQIAAARLQDAGLLEHPDIGPWLRTMVEKVLLSR